MKKYFLICLLLIAMFMVSAVTKQVRATGLFSPVTACEAFWPEILKPPEPTGPTKMYSAGLSLNLDNWSPLIAIGLTALAGFAGFRKLLKLLVELKAVLAKATEIFADGKITPDELKEFKQECKDVVTAAKELTQRVVVDKEQET